MLLVVIIRVWNMVLKWCVVFNWCNGGNEDGYEEEYFSV